MATSPTKPVFWAKYCDRCTLRTHKKPISWIPNVASILIPLLSEVARIERQNIKERLNSGRARYKAVGGKLGRPQGTGLSHAELLAKYPGVSRRLRKGQTIGDIAQLESVSESTVKKVKKALLGA